MLSKIVDQVKTAAQQEQQTQERQKISLQELEAAWKVLCPNGDSMSRSEAEHWLKLFYPDIPSKHVKQLAKDGISFETLQQLLVDQLPQGVDANVQALKALDPERTGAVDINTLEKVMVDLHNTGPLSEQDTLTLMQLADADTNGKIGLQDLTQFRLRRQAAVGGPPSPTVANAKAGNSATVGTVPGLR